MLVHYIGKTLKRIANNISDGLKWNENLLKNSQGFQFLSMKQEKDWHENLFANKKCKQAMMDLHFNKDVQMQALIIRKLYINIFILYILHP